MRSLLKRVVPPRLVGTLRRLRLSMDIRRVFRDDARRYLTQSAALNNGDEAALRAKIAAHYHVLEKGLSNANMRAGYGTAVIGSLISLLDDYRSRGYACCCSQYQSAMMVLRRYGELHHELKHAILPQLQAFLCGSPDGPTEGVSGGAVARSRPELQARWTGDFAALARARCSARHFSDEPVEIDKIRRAVALAQRSPSSCNRQPSAVHVLANRQDIQALLDVHLGARGFAEMVDKLLVVTADLKAYWGAWERKLCIVDGSLFAMSLIYALCHEGLGCCCLHWAVPGHHAEALVRHLAKLRASEEVVLLLAVGNLPPTFLAAHSQRKPVDEVLFVH